ncbi:ral guanine nucleotide dissociation stimulator-like [Marmota marmota marmota]|uniref:ral guanine nucleotide dissociation stimulator-like n=1 Tax=Marmota marmota marmota TaxID=9994 RepID=UPI002092C9EC|nr:ral guanine nucleotide dissociation stimulator-like [Marmota marmota marmota]
MVSPQHGMVADLGRVLPGPLGGWGSGHAPARVLPLPARAAASRSAPGPPREASPRPRPLRALQPQPHQPAAPPRDLQAQPKPTILGAWTVGSAVGRGTQDRLPRVAPPGFQGVRFRLCPSAGLGRMTEYRVCTGTLWRGTRGRGGELLLHSYIFC